MHSKCGGHRRRLVRELSVVNYLVLTYSEGNYSIPEVQPRTKYSLNRCYSKLLSAVLMWKDHLDWPVHLNESLQDEPELATIYLLHNLYRILADSVGVFFFFFSSSGSSLWPIQVNSTRLSDWRQTHLLDSFPTVFSGAGVEAECLWPLDQGFFEVKVQLMFLLVHLRHLTLSLASHFTLRCAHGMQALYTRWYSYSRDPLPLLFAWSMGGYLGAM